MSYSQEEPASDPSPHTSRAPRTTSRDQPAEAHSLLAIPQRRGMRLERRRSMKHRQREQPDNLIRPPRRLINQRMLSHDVVMAQLHRLRQPRRA